MEYINCNICGIDDAELLFSKKDKFRISKEDFNVVRCRNCGLIYINPRPSEEEIVGFYPDTYSWKETPKAESLPTKIVTGLERSYRFQLLNYEVNKVLSYTPQGGGKVLDIGCGTGDRLKVFRRKGFDVYGVEVSPQARYAREHLNLNVMEGNLLKAGYAGDFFDVITMYNVFEHVHDPRKLLQEIRRVLKAKGYLVVGVPSTDSIQYHLFRKRWSAFDLPRDLFYFNPSLLRRLLEEGGFQVIGVDHDSNWWHPPTFTLSLFPGLDPQFFWKKPDSTWEATCSRIAWALVTVTIAPVFTFLERLLKRSAIVTVYARKR